MFSFLTGKTAFKDIQLIKGSSDVHSHLLPGVDDGVSTMEEARKTIAHLEGLGVSKIFLTPHIAAELHDNQPANLKARFKQFLTECPSNIEFKLAGEYMLDNKFVEHLIQDTLTYDGLHLLVETSYIAPPNDFENLLYEIQLHELIPVLAHPERYLYQNASGFERLKKIGVKFQLNLFSLTGQYGEGVRDMALSLLREGAYDFVGSDIHRLSTYEGFFNKLKVSKSQIKNLERLYDNNQLLF